MSISLQYLFIRLYIRGLSVFLLTPMYDFSRIPVVRAGSCCLFYPLRMRAFATPFAGAKHDAIIDIISAEVVPVRVPEPVPAIQVAGTGVRAVPEVPVRHESSILGEAPSFPPGNSPPEAINRSRGSTSPRPRARPRKPRRQDRRTSRTRGTRFAGILSFRLSPRRRRSIGHQNLVSLMLP